jgi:putative ABC transport system permease protein
MILTAFGAVLGIVLTFTIEAILKETNPATPILITADWVGAAALLALAGASIGAIYPSLRAASYDPVVALAYE